MQIMQQPEWHKAKEAQIRPKSLFVCFVFVNMAEKSGFGWSVVFIVYLCLKYAYLYVTLLL